MKPNRAIIVLAAVAAGIAIGAVVMKGRAPSPESPDLPPVAIEAQ